MKADFLFAGLNIMIQEKKRHKKALFMNDALKARGIIYLNVENWLVFAPPCKLLATRWLYLKCYRKLLMILRYLLVVPVGLISSKEHWVSGLLICW